jgi:hypothetical protein
MQTVAIAKPGRVASDKPESSLFSGLLSHGRKSSRADGFENPRQSPPALAGHDVIGAVNQGLGSPSQMLNARARGFMESRFGRDFTGVRVHSNQQAAESARMLKARAFTVGNDIVFGEGHYQTGTTTGRRLLAHELAHTVQQRGRAEPAFASLRATRAGDPQEREAQVAADAVISGTPFRLTHSSEPRLARAFEDESENGSGGPAPTSGSGTGTAATPPATGSGSASSPGPASPPSAGPASPPSPGPASPVRLLRVEVHPDHRGHFPQIPGTGAGSHWVGVASDTARKPIVRAVLDPAVPAGDPRVAGLTWSGSGVTPDAGNPLEAEVDRMAGRRRVTGTLNGTSRSTTVWAVFARIQTTAGPTPDFTPNAAWGRPGATVDFSAKIFPNSITTDADHPRLDGGRDTPPPGGTHPINLGALAGGADHHWDFSRKSRCRVLNPSGIALPTLVMPGGDLANLFANAPWGYPARWEEGNDDSGTTDENNDPYAGAMTSTDTPGMRFNNAGGVDGDTFEIRLHFFEFVRLELARAWWVISHLFPWRVHMRARKAAGHWVDDGTTAASDNAGF